MFFIANSRIQCGNINLFVKNSSKISCEKTNTCAVTNQHSHCATNCEMYYVNQSSTVDIVLIPTYLSQISFRITNILSNAFVTILDRPPASLT